MANTIFASCDRSTDLARRLPVALVLPVRRPAARGWWPKLRRAVEAMQIPQKDSGGGPWLTISVGTATALPAEDQPHDLIQVADRGPLPGKRQGRNAWCRARSWSPGMGRRRAQP